MAIYISDFIKLNNNRVSLIHWIKILMKDYLTVSKYPESKLNLKKKTKHNPMTVVINSPHLDL